PGGRARERIERAPDAGACIRRVAAAAMYAGLGRHTAGPIGYTTRNRGAIPACTTTGASERTLMIRFVLIGVGAIGIFIALVGPTVTGEITGAVLFPYCRSMSASDAF